MCGSGGSSSPLDRVSARQVGNLAWNRYTIALQPITIALQPMYTFDHIRVPTSIIGQSECASLLTRKRRTKKDGMYQKSLRRPWLSGHTTHCNHVAREKRYRAVGAIRVPRARSLYGLHLRQ